ncbi:DUF423 domain-containing protein [Aestuariirhabdus sp. LZHN29]|uniref:DUF423 domain-containing protein n=1 Tax=Aestuariirhabdus sp. LZHN29 TaxID=3417462 RepID=UPI003CF10290
MRVINLMISIGAIGGFSAVALGAYGAHGLSGMPAPLQQAYQSAVQYQFYHSLALVLVALLMHWRGSRLLVVAGLGFAVGLFLFCGSIYLRLLLGLDIPRLLTPAGGIAFMLGWAGLLGAAWRHRESKEGECRFS